MKKHQKKPATTSASAPQKMEAFTFGEPSAVLDRRDILDYVECINNGKWYEPPVNLSGLAKSLRAAVHHSSPIYVKRNILTSTYIPHPFAPGSVFHLLEPDINQELYGMPEYLSALNSAWLNESATLFRRKYYQNGAHAGYIMYVTDAAQSSTDVESLRSAMRDSKGLGNFKNLFFYAPNGKPDGIKIVPLSEVATKDDFFNIKKVSAADLLDAHRVPFQLMGGKPENIGSMGDVEKVARVFVRNELTPLQERFKEINDGSGWR